MSSCCYAQLSGLDELAALKLAFWVREEKMCVSLKAGVVVFVLEQNGSEVFWESLEKEAGTKVEVKAFEHLDWLEDCLVDAVEGLFAHYFDLLGMLNFLVRPSVHIGYEIPWLQKPDDRQKQ